MLRVLAIAALSHIFEFIETDQCNERIDDSFQPLNKRSMFQIS